MPEFARDGSKRCQLERLIGAELRELTLESDWLGRSFAGQNSLAANDFRALLFVTIAERTGECLTAGDLRRRMKLSGAAITYLVERMTNSGLLRREADPNDRRKVILRHADNGALLARTFLKSLDEHTHRSLDGLTDADLLAAHRTFKALGDGMRAFRAECAERDATDRKAG